MDRIERLLGMGYFPSQLPPCFRTQDLAINHAVLFAEWLKTQRGMGARKGEEKAPSSKPEVFSVARAGYKRRVTSLPNPVSQTFLATHIVRHWGQIVKHYRQSKLSVSRPRFHRSGPRAANIPSMHGLYERKIIRAAGYRYMLRTDISRFFPTIYTHSVPWAFHGKSLAKRNTRPTPKFFGNLLDRSLRQGQEKQTIGLPIGPDTSHIIAEAIATSIDILLEKHAKLQLRGFRYVDDYFLFFATLKEAETALAALVRSLSEFELQINFEKTETARVLEISDDYWTHQIRNFPLRKVARSQASDINHFFELAKDLARRNSDENVMTYALKRASSVVVRKDNWECFEAHICHIALGYPNTLQTVARLLSTYNHVGYPIHRERLSRLVNTIIEDHAPFEHHSEVAWALWMCKDLRLALSDSSVALVSTMHSSVCLLLLLDIASSGKLPVLPRPAICRQVEKVEALHGDLWLLSYEAGVRAWGGMTDTHVRADPFFESLRLRDVHFYDTAAVLTPIFHVKAGVLEQFQLYSIGQLFERPDIDDYIEYDDDDGGYEGVIVQQDGDDGEQEPAYDESIPFQ